MQLVGYMQVISDITPRTPHRVIGCHLGGGHTIGPFSNKLCLLRPLEGEQV
jgi:hypothetical protein